MVDAIQCNKSALDGHTVVFSFGNCRIVCRSEAVNKGSVVILFAGLSFLVSIFIPDRHGYDGRRICFMIFALIIALAILLGTPKQ